MKLNAYLLLISALMGFSAVAASNSQLLSMSDNDLLAYAQGHSIGQCHLNIGGATSSFKYSFKSGASVISEGNDGPYIAGIIRSSISGGKCN